MDMIRAPRDFLPTWDAFKTGCSGPSGQISSGLRVQTASDAPEQVLQILRLRPASRRIRRCRRI